MRWLIVHPGPEFSVHDVCVGWEEALRQLGEHVAVYNMADRLTFYDSVAIETGREVDGVKEFRKALTHEQAIDLAANGLLSAAYQFWPDVVLCVSGFFTTPLMLDVMRSRRHKIVMLHTESPYEDDAQLERAAHVDVNLLNDPVNIAAYRALGVPAEYAPHAYRPAVHAPGPGDPELKCDLAFSGTGYQSRIDFFEAMDLAGVEVALAGNWCPLTDDSPLCKYLIHDRNECLDNPATALLYRSARAGINFYRREAESPEHVQGWAMGPREVEMAATGLWFLRDSRPESDEVFPMLPAFDGPGDASEKLRWWLARDSARDHARRAAREAIRDRTFESNARMLLRLLDRVPVTI